MWPSKIYPCSGPCHRKAPFKYILAGCFQAGPKGYDKLGGFAGLVSHYDNNF